MMIFIDLGHSSEGNYEMDRLTVYYVVFAISSYKDLAWIPSRVPLCQQFGIGVD